MVSNCLWKDGVLTLKFKQPFDMLSEFITDIRDQKMPESAKMGEFEKWLPFVDHYRTLCIAPDQEMIAVFLAFRGQKFKSVTGGMVT